MVYFTWSVSQTRVRLFDQLYTFQQAVSSSIFPLMNELLYENFLMAIYGFSKADFHDNITVLFVLIFF